MSGTNGHGAKKAVLYARVSTDEQARSGYSLAQQMEALRAHTAREGYDVLEEVEDAGQSGASLERPGMDRVRDLVAAGDVAVVLAQDRDRFAREPAYHYLLRREFEERGTKLRALNDRGDGSPEGELTDGILDQLAKFERAKTAERTRRGKQRKVREGKIVASRAAFGFDYNAARDGYVVDPEQMDVVRLIFRMAGVERATIYAIRRHLEGAGLRTPSGKPKWDASFVRGLLLNDLYKPHSFDEIRRIVSADVAARLDPGAFYGVWWSGRRSFERKRVSRDGPDGREYRFEYKVRERPPEDRIGVPVPDSGVPREWVDAARGPQGQPQARQRRAPRVGALGRDLALRRVQPGDERPLALQAQSELLLLLLLRRRLRQAAHLHREQEPQGGGFGGADVGGGLRDPQGPRPPARRPRRDDRAGEARRGARRPGGRSPYVDGQARRGPPQEGRLP